MHLRSSTTWLLAASLVAAGGAWAGCGGDPEPFDPSGTTSASGAGPGTTAGSGGAGGSGGSTANGSGGSDAEPNQGEEMFQALEADLMGACGVCHDAGGPSNTPFLAGPDRYATISSWPDVVKVDWQNSILLTFPVSGGGHSGSNLDSSAYATTLLPAVEAWLEEEARGILEGGEGGGAGAGGAPPEEQPTIPPFKPILGFNAVYLHPLDEAFTGMAITFSAEELTPTSLQLTNMQVHTTSELGLHIVHPLFVVYPVGDDADPDPVDSFSNLDAYFEPGTGDDLGPGTLILTNWSSDAKLSVAFETIAAYDPNGGEGGGGGGGGNGGAECEAQGAFDAVADEFTPCLTCHNGQNPGATGALDMRDLDNDTGAACVQIRNRVDLGDPPSSQIFIVTDPNGGAGHPFKFGNNVNTWNNFRTQVTAWINAEAP